MGFQVYIGDGFKPGDIVNQEGCSIEQVCPCQTDWKSKGKYVSCVADISGDFRKDGLISKSESAKITSEAAKSSCGGK